MSGDPLPEEPDHRQRRLLRARRERPSGRRATDERDEVAPLHCSMPPMLPSERIAHLSKAGDCCAAGFQSGLGRFRVKMRRTRSEHILSALPPLTTEERTPESAAPCRLCCKSPKLPGDKILAIRRTNRRPPIYAASVTLPSSPASSSSGNEVPHIFTRKSRLQPGEFLVTSAKRLLQQYLPLPDLRPAAKGIFARSPRRR